MRDSFRNQVAVIGVGCTRFGELYEASAEQLICEAAFEALADAKVEPAQIEAAWLAKVAVKNHHNGTLSPKAHLRMEINEETVLKAPMIYSPLGLFDCCPTTDGAAAAVLCRADRAKEFRPDLVYVKGIGLSVMSGQPYYKPTYDYVSFPATQRAATVAYEQAGVGAAD